MIAGHVAGLQARVEVLFRVSNQPDLTIEFVVDTGFAGALTLPPAAVTALGLTYFTQSGANLADGSLISAAVHRATVVWDSAPSRHRTPR